jgi:hemolysin activation/secretion protein
VTLPGPADINRIAPAYSGIPPPPSNGPTITIPASSSPETPVPANAKSIHFILHGFRFKNVTVFSSQQLKELYASYVGKDVTLDIAWKIADALTEKYQKEGYFLSQAFVPAQEIDSGVLEIQVIEGYVSEVSMMGAPPPESAVINKAIEALKAEIPIRLQTLERQLLLLNDLPGLSFKATLASSKGKATAAVRLILTVAKTKGVTTLSANNSGSLYLGPYQVSADWSGSMVPLQQTDMSITSVPVVAPAGGHLFSANATQKIMLAPAIGLDLTGGYSNAVPGFTLKPVDISSQAVNGGIGISYSLIRQRDENLSARFSVDFHDSTINILNSVLSQDKIRAMQFGVKYDRADSLLGHNYFDVELRRGLPILGSSSADDTDLTRPDVHPDFTKMTVNYTRLQDLTKDWSSSLVLSGQKASGTLYSS